MSTERQPIDDDDQPGAFMSYYEGALRAARDGLGVYSTVDHMLDHAPLETMTPTAILAVVTMTFHGKAFLARRDAFLVRAEAVLRTQLGDNARVDRLLENRR